jgi:integrase
MVRQRASRIKFHTQADIDALWSRDAVSSPEIVKQRKAGRARSPKPRGLHIVWRGKIRYVIGTYRGTRVRRTTGQADKTVAESVMADIQREIDDEIDRARMARRLPDKHLAATHSPVVTERTSKVTAPDLQPPGQLAGGSSANKGPAESVSADQMVVMPQSASELSARVREKLAMMPRPDPVPEGKMRTFWEACDRYLAGRKEDKILEQQVKTIQKLVGEERFCKDIDDDLMRWLKTVLMRDTSSPQTYLRQVITPVKAITSMATSLWGPAQGCPALKFEVIPEGKGRTITLLPGHAEQLISRARESGYQMLADFIPIALCEGPRRSEMFNLRWEYVDLTHRRMILLDTKSDQHEYRQRIIQDLRPRTHRILMGMRKRRRSDIGPVFGDPTLRGYAENGRGFSSDDTMGAILNRQLKTLVEQLGIPDHITLHVFRHSAASYHYLVEPNLLAVKKRMDWRSLKITERYVHELHKSQLPAVLSFWEADDAASKRA